MKSLAAASLSPVNRERSAFDVPLVGDRHHHVLFLDQILDLDLGFVFDDLGATGLSVLLFDLLELLHDDVHQQVLAGQDGSEPEDLVAELAVLFGQLLLLEPGEATQSHLQDGFCLSLAELIRLPAGRGLDFLFRTTSASHEGFQAVQRKGHQPVTRLFGIARLTDGLDHEIDLGHRHAEPFDGLPPLLRLGQVEARASADYVPAVLDE